MIDFRSDYTLFKTQAENHIQIATGGYGKIKYEPIESKMAKTESVVGQINNYFNGTHPFNFYCLFNPSFTRSYEFASSRRFCSQNFNKQAITFLLCGTPLPKEIISRILTCALPKTDLSSEDFQNLIWPFFKGFIDFKGELIDDQIYKQFKKMDPEGPFEKPMGFDKAAINAEKTAIRTEKAAKKAEKSSKKVEKAAKKIANFETPYEKCTIQ